MHVSITNESSRIFVRSLEWINDIRWGDLLHKFTEFWFKNYSHWRTKIQNNTIGNYK